MMTSRLILIDSEKIVSRGIHSLPTSDARKICQERVGKTGNELTSGSFTEAGSEIQLVRSAFHDVAG